MITFLDIETGPASDEVLALVKPEFKAPSNYKDADKIKAAIAEAEVTWRERAALSPLTGQLLAIGLMDAEDTSILVGDEKGMLVGLWCAWNQGMRLVGFAIKAFDLPFLIARSRILNVPVPQDLFETRYWSYRITDLQEIWNCFSYGAKEGNSLDAICKACGLPGKLEGVTGADFAKLFASDRPKAMEYLKADLSATAALASRLGIQ